VDKYDAAGMGTPVAAPRVHVEVQPCSLGDTLLALRYLIVVVSLLPSALVSPPRRSRRSLFTYLLFASHLPRNCFFLPFACLPIQETETHSVLLPREIEMLHSGKRWVADWKHRNYTAAIKATEVRSSVVFTFSFEIWSGGVSEGEVRGEDRG
jgi:hypothetical protein